MPALVPTEYTGTLVWLGTVPDRDADLASEARESVFAGFAGVAEEDHAGLTRASCSRVVSQYLKGTEIRNVRQLTILSQEELFLSLNDVIGDSATVHLKDQVRGTDLSFDRIVWENSTNAGPEIAARSLFWDGDFFILAFTTEPGIQVTKAHLALHQLFVDNLRLSESETQ